MILKSRKDPMETGVALVGCGALMELFYAPAMKALSPAYSLRITALVDPNPDRLAVLGVHFPAALRVATVDALPSGVASIAIVASPQRFHAEQTILLLGRGFHVLCEKPMAASMQEAAAMIEAARQAGRLLSVGLFRRFFPSSQLVKDMVDGGILGRPLSFEWAEGGPFNWPAVSASFFQRSASPGGVFADIGAHIIDLVLWWFGEVEVANYEDDAMGGIEANCCLRLVFKGGVSGLIRLSRDTPISNGTRIRFERGSVRFTGASADSVVIEMDGCRHLAKASLHQRVAPESVAEVGAPARTYAQSFMEQIVNLHRAANGEEQLLVSGEEAIKSVGLIDRCYKSRKVMGMPWLGSTEVEGGRRLANQAPYRS